MPRKDPEQNNLQQGAGLIRSSRVEEARRYR
jgi:hypothetical protein